MKRFAVYHQDMVVLDVCEDSFSIIQDANVENEIMKLITLTKNEYSWLHDIGIIKDIGYVKGADRVMTSFLEERWMLPERQAIKPSCGFGMMIRFIKFFLNARNVRRKGFPWIASKIKNKRKTINGIDDFVKNESDEIINTSINEVSSVFYLLGASSNCLTYSFCLVQRLLENGIDAKLVVGVRTRPFFSHAWVEVNNVVINDDVFLREKLAVIFDE